MVVFKPRIFFKLEFSEKKIFLTNLNMAKTRGKSRRIVHDYKRDLIYKTPHIYQDIKSVIDRS